MSDEQSQRPTTDDRDVWGAYWKALGMPWRTEPEVDEARQRFLAERRVVKPDIERGIYPFRDENGSIKLTRADVEWLLATHESGGMQGPVEWHDLKQREREGLDLRGADLQDADLRLLPLSRLVAGLDAAHSRRATRERRLLATVRLERSNLTGAHLEGACLSRARLEGADMTGAHLECAALWAAHLESADVSRARMAGTSVRSAYFDSAVYLNNAVLSDGEAGALLVADARWNGVNLATVLWSQVIILGDEREARQAKAPDGTRKDAATRRRQYEWAVRANRQLATVLRDQGLNENADRFAYRARMLQRHVLRRQGRWVHALASWLLDVIAGYGYKPMRTVFAYVVIICLFAGAYLLNSQFAASHLHWDEALVLSISSFHGRGFFTTGISLGDTLARLAAGEAIIGLVIEITFIATFTQRFFAR